MAANVLLIEDDPGISYGLMLALRLAGYSAHHGKTIAEAKVLIERAEPQLIILDVNLPDGSGFKFCQDVLSISPRIPIIMLTARTDEESAVHGLRLGAIDYIRKPSGTREILARVDRFLSGAKVLRFGPIDVKPDQRSVTVNGNPVELGKREFEILSVLLRQAEKVVSRDTILESVSADADTSDRAIDTHLSRIRTKLRRAGAEEVQITAVYGVGYKLTAKVG